MKHWTFKYKKKGTLTKTRSSLFFFLQVTVWGSPSHGLPYPISTVSSEQQVERPGNKLVLPMKCKRQWDIDLHHESILQVWYPKVKAMLFWKDYASTSPTSFCPKTVNLSCSQTNSTLVFNITIPRVRAKLWLTVAQCKWAKEEIDKEHSTDKKFRGWGKLHWGTIRSKTNY